MEIIKKLPCYLLKDLENVCWVQTRETEATYDPLENFKLFKHAEVKPDLTTAAGIPLVYE